MNDTIDEFESMFRAADREVYTFADVPIENISLVTDGSQLEAEVIQSKVLKFLPRLESANWRYLVNDDYQTVSELLQKLNSSQTDLVITYRHLQEKSLIPQHSLGVYLDVLTQSFSIPVLVLPGTAASPITFDDRVCNRVMVITDHISGDNRLINYGARMCVNGGTIWLCHVEDDSVFNRYKAAISRIPEIETETAPELLKKQLLKDAGDFIETCITELSAAGPNASYQMFIGMGHHLSEYRSLIDKHEIDLVVANTKDEDQLAMHGITYSASVELIKTALLLL